MPLAPPLVMLTQMNALRGAFLGAAPFFEMEQAEESIVCLLQFSTYLHRHSLVVLPAMVLCYPQQQNLWLCVYWKGRVWGVSLLIPFCREFQKT